MFKTIITKNISGDTGYMPYIDVDICKEIENINKIMELCKQKFYETTFIHKNIYEERKYKIL